jgi:hypothetical protein
MTITVQKSYSKITFLKNDFVIKNILFNFFNVFVYTGVLGLFGDYFKMVETINSKGVQK